jgi:PAS domain S-box-containing protein
VAGVLVALALSGLVYRYYYQPLATRTFQQYAERQAHELEDEFQAILETLTDLHAAYTAMGGFTADAFRTLVQPALKRHPAIQALAWVPLVPAAQRDAVEATAQADGRMSFVIKERAHIGDLVRAGQRLEYFPVYFVEPLAGNTATLGFDLGSEPTRLAGLMQARDSGATTITARLRLLHEYSPQYSVMISSPLYQRGALPNTVTARREQLRGFLLLMLPLDDVVRSIVQRWAQPGVEYTLSDVTATSPGEVLSSSRSPNTPTSPSWEQTVSLANRQWRLTFWLNPAVAAWAMPFPWWAWAVGLSGCAGTLLLSAYLWNVSRYTARLRQAAQHLLDSEARGTAIIASAMDAIIIIDAQHHVVLFNAAAEQMFGYTAMEVIGESLDRFIPIEARAAHRAHIVTATQTETSTRGMTPSRTAHGVRANGEIFPIEVATSAVQVAGQRWYTAIIRDVSEHQRTQHSLLEQTRLAVLESSISDIIAQHHDYTVVCQRSAEEMVASLQVAFIRIWLLNEADHMLELQASAGMYREIERASSRIPVQRQAIDTSAGTHRSFLPNDILMHIRMYDQEWARREGLTFAAEYPLLASGHLVGGIALFARQPLSANVGNTVSTIARNLALGLERSRARNALRESELHFRQLTEHLHDAFYLYDAASNQVLYMSPAYEEMWGRSVQVLYQQPKDCLKALHPEDKAGVYAMLRRRVQGENTVGEYRIIQPHGEVRWILDHAFPFRVGPESSYRVVGIAKDITERKQAAAVLQQMNERLEQRVAERTAALRMANTELAKATRLKDEFLASMSHELRTPLNAILGLSEALLEEVYGPLTEKQGQSLQHIEESGRHLLALITDILDLAKIEAGKMDLLLNTVDVENVCQASLRLVRDSARKKQLHLTMTIDPRVTTLIADERHLKQMLVNLLSNAVKFTPAAGSIGIEVRGQPDEETVTFAVWDTGIGIAPEDSARLFQPFVQLDSSLARHHTGTGLGLSLVARLARLHEGRVTLESTVGQGSRFSVVLPWQEAAQVAEPAPLPEPADTDTPQGMELEARPLILLAEDNPMNVTMLDEYLRLKGYTVAVASTGTEALEQARALRPTLILMDIQMPGMDGLEATRLLRAEADAALAATPIVALTALAMPEDCARCLAAGASAYVAKPFKLQALLQVIAEQCATAPIHEVL